MSAFNLKEELLSKLPISETQLNALILRSPYIYKKYSIPKKSGGVRQIAQPARATKYLQRMLIELIYENLPMHDCVTAYKKGASIKKNALAHCNNSYFAKFDFKDFFTSIKGTDLVAHLVKHSKDTFTEKDLEDISRISCIKSNGREALNLSIGAPSSPIISNTILYDFDLAVNEWCYENNIVYTRYADDLTFSTNVKNKTSIIEPFIRDVVRRLDYPNLRFNTKKTIFLSKKHQRKVTGLIITNEGNISLGRNRKRLISSMIHKFKLSILPEIDVPQLQGLLGLAKDIEPNFIERMNLKYGKETISELFKFRK